MIRARRIFAGMFPLSGKSCYNEKFLEDASLSGRKAQRTSLEDFPGTGRQREYNG